MAKTKSLLYFVILSYVNGKINTVSFWYKFFVVILNHWFIFISSTLQRWSGIPRHAKWYAWEWRTWKCPKVSGKGGSSFRRWKRHVVKINKTYYNAILWQWFIWALLMENTWVINFTGNWCPGYQPWSTKSFRDKSSKRCW